MNIRISVALAAVSLLASGYADAVPCGTYGIYGGVQEAVGCRNGLDAQDSVDDLNGGNFFGFNDWEMLARLTPATPDSADFWSVSPPNGKARSGTLTLAAGLWDQFASLVVVLRDGASWHDNRFKWSAYLLPAGQYGTYHWSYDGGYKNLTNMTLYGRVAPVSEPASLALVATGVAGVMFLRRRRRKA